MADAISVQAQHVDLQVDPDLCRRTLAHVAESEGARIESLTVILADHQTVHDLNRRYLDHDYVTDVLAFDYSEDIPDPEAARGDRSTEHIVDGEIYVDLDTAHERHSEFGAGFTHEALRYVIHGMLHLVGYSDRSPGEKQEMHRLESRYLKELHIPEQD